MNDTVRSVVIPMAGNGRRLRPLTYLVQKELLPVGSSSLAKRAAREAVEAGVTRIICVVPPRLTLRFAVGFLVVRIASVVARLPGMLARRPSESWLTRAEFVPMRREDTPSLAGAILRAKDTVGPGAFAVILPDDLVFDDNSLARLIECQQQRGGWAVGTRRIQTSEFGDYGVVAGALAAPGTLRIRRATEKPQKWPTPEPSGIVGRYILGEDVFPRLQSAIEGDQTSEPFTRVLDGYSSSGDLWGVELSGRHVHAGTPRGYLEAWSTRRARGNSR